MTIHTNHSKRTYIAVGPNMRSRGRCARTKLWKLEEIDRLPNLHIRRGSKQIQHGALDVQVAGTDDIFHSPLTHADTGKSREEGDASYEVQTDHQFGPRHRRCLV